MKRYSNGGRGSPYVCEGGPWVLYQDHEVALAEERRKERVACAELCKQVQDRVR